MTFDLQRLATVQLVPPTPFSPDGQKLVPERLTELVASLFDAGIRVFLPAAGTGEFHSLTSDEVLACVQATKQAVRDQAIVIAPIGFGVAHAVQIGRGALEIGADALLLMPPVHSYLSDSGFRDYVEAISRTVPLPLLAYKRGPVPSDRLLIELGSAGRLVGIKYAVNDLDAFTRFTYERPSTLGVYCGTAERFAPFFALAGAQGYTSGLGNICPHLTLSLHNALTSGDFAAAMRTLQFVRPIEDFRARDNDSYNISAIKSALRIAGRDFGPPRPPLRQLTTAEYDELHRLVEPILAVEAELA